MFVVSLIKNFNFIKQEKPRIFITYIVHHKAIRVYYFFREGVSFVVAVIMDFTEIISRGDLFYLRCLMAGNV